MLAAVALLPSCDNLPAVCEPTPLSQSVAPFSGTSLRLDGFFYQRPDDPASNPAVEYFVLYEEGIMLYAFREYFDQLDDEYQTLVETSPNYGVDCQSCWGAFWVDGQDFTLEQWQDDPCSESVYRRTGRILNDSTILMKSWVIIDGATTSDPVTISDTFSLRPAAVKPDTRNSVL